MTLSGPTSYESALERLRSQPARWLITGVAGFIGSNLLETLLREGQSVVGIDNFATGHRRNLDAVLSMDGSWRNRFTFIEGDIRDADACRTASAGVEYVLHEAALGSVPRSLADPVTTNSANVEGFLQVMLAARDAGAKRVIYAGSSSTYGDDPNLPKVESRVGRPLSPYAVSKAAVELYANVFRNAYGLGVIGLRYFNVFGPRQDPEGVYAAVIPRWIGELLSGKRRVINGDGETSRDFCFVENVVQANILAALAAPECEGEVFNVAYGATTTLNELELILVQGLRDLGHPVSDEPAERRPFRAGDVRNSLASIDKARTLLGYEPRFSARSGLQRTMRWYLENAAKIVA